MARLRCRFCGSDPHVFLHQSFVDFSISSMSTRSLQFKVANQDWEFEQIHQLNYRTFVEEIPQHQPSATPRLVDKFHHENTYLICLSNNRIVGMIAARGRRP